MSQENDEKTFALELEGKTSVVHLTTCQVFIEKTRNGKGNDGWIFPFETYKEAFQHGKDLEDRSYPKVCGKFRPWGNGDGLSEVSWDLLISDENITQVYNKCLSWALHKKTRITSNEKNEFITSEWIKGRDDPNVFLKINLSKEPAGVLVRGELRASQVKTKLPADSGGLELPDGWKDCEEDFKKYIVEHDFELGTYEVSVISNARMVFRNLVGPREPISKVSDVVYEKLPTMSTLERRSLITLSILLFVSHYILTFRSRYDLLVNNGLYFFATYGVALVYLYLVYKTDKYEREPYVLVLLLFSWGVFSGYIAGNLNRLFGPFFEMLYGSNSLVAAFVEEPVKALGLYLLVRYSRYGKEFNTPLDGIVYGFSIGIGFFAMENFYYYLRFGPSTLVRNLMNWEHGVYVAVTGLWLAIAKVKRGKVEIVDIFPGLLVAIFLHLLWNEFIVYLGTIDGRLIMLFLLWELGYLQKMIMEAWRDEILWGYSTGKAPIEI